MSSPCRRAVVALALGLALTTGGDVTTAFATPCVDCPQFTQLRSDITSFVPTRFRNPLLTRTSLAERFQPGDPCRAFHLLSSIGSQVSGLGRAGQLSVDGVSASRSDITNIQPGDPCKG